MDINNDKGKGKEREKKRKRKRASEKKKAQYGKPINDSYWDMIGGVKEGGEEGGEEREGEKEMKFRCLDCRGEMERRELYVLERCGHCFCVDCLFDYLQGKMVEYQFCIFFFFFFFFNFFFFFIAQSYSFPLFFSSPFLPFYFPSPFPFLSSFFSQDLN